MVTTVMTVGGGIAIGVNVTLKIVMEGGTAAKMAAGNVAEATIAMIATPTTAMTAATGIIVGATIAAMTGSTIATSIAAGIMPRAITTDRKSVV